MLESLRQVAFLVRDLPEAAELYRKTLGMAPCNAGKLPEYGLDNMVLPAGQGPIPQSSPTDTLARFRPTLILIVCPRSIFFISLSTPHPAAQRMAVTGESSHSHHSDLRA